MAASGYLIINGVSYYSARGTIQRHYNLAPGVPSANERVWQIGVVIEDDTTGQTATTAALLAAAALPDIAVTLPDGTVVAHAILLPFTDPQPTRPATITVEIHELLP